MEGGLHTMYYILCQSTIKVDMLGDVRDVIVRYFVMTNARRWHGKIIVKNVKPLKGVDM